MTNLDTLRSTKSIRQILIFGVIGLANTGAFFIIANGLHLILGETASAYLAYAMLLPVSYFGHRRLTFKSDAALGREWIKFCIVQAFNLSLIGSVTGLSALYHSLSGWPAFAIISLLVPLLNYIIFQLWVFAKT